LLARLAADPDHRDRLGRGARAFAESFSWERTAQQTESHLAAVLAARPGGQEA
jgi:glycosyltransferase involved in cell wall biosynthesis